ncbi:unnamed protein product [Rhodiola kirilowii]
MNRENRHPGKPMLRYSSVAGSPLLGRSLSLEQFWIERNFKEVRLCRLSSPSHRCSRSMQP